MGRYLPDNFMSNIKSKPSSSIMPTKHEPVEHFSSSYKLDFSKASKDFWVKNVSKYQSTYDKGSTVGKFGKYNSNLEDFFDRMFVLVKECITTELTNQGYTSEQLENQFKVLESTFKILVDVVKSIDTEKKLSTDSLCAFLHGFVNGYMENFAETKGKQA